MNKLKPIIKINDMKLQITDITKIAIFAALIAVFEAIESFLPALNLGGTIKLSEVAVTTLVLLALYKFQNKTYTAKIMLISTLLAATICYFTGLFKYATTPTVAILDYLIPFFSPIVIVFAAHHLIKSKLLLTILAQIIAFTSHVISGIVVYKSPLIASISYNIWYCLLTLVVQMFVVVVLHKRKF